MKKTHSAPLSPSNPLLEETPEAPRAARLKRLVWILAAGVVLIGVLYLALTRNKPVLDAPESLSQGEDSPDAVIEKLHLVSSLQGQKRWELFASGARVYQNEKLAYADNIFAQYYKKDKIVSTLTADKALINTESDATQAQGHVELVVENGSKLETEKLNWDPDKDEIQTDGRVHVYKGTDDITAVGLTADTQLNNIRFNKDVHTQVRDTKQIEKYDESKKF
jgi:LPS export ABC transporter protein LptC